MSGCFLNWQKLKPEIFLNWYIKDEKNLQRSFVLSSVKVNGTSKSVMVKVLLPMPSWIRKPYIPYWVIVLACFHAKGTGHISFTTSGCSSNKDVPVFCNVFTGCQTVDQCFVQLSSRMVIDRCDAGIWLFKLSLTDQSFQTIVFTVAVFDINKHAKSKYNR